MPSRNRSLRPTTSTTTSTDSNKKKRTSISKRNRSMGNATSSPTKLLTITSSPSSSSKSKKKRGLSPDASRKRVRYNRRASCAKELALLIGEGGAQILNSQRRANYTSGDGGGRELAKEKVSKALKVLRAPKKRVRKKAVTPSSPSPSTTTPSSPRKTRAAAQKNSRSSNPDVEDLSDLKCELCGQSKPLQTLRNCPQCVSIFHLSCLRLEPALLSFFTANPHKWECPRCVSCSRCKEYIHDPDNVQCIGCGRIWHGACASSKGSHSLEYPCINWQCDRCKGKGEKHSSPPTTAKSKHRTVVVSAATTPQSSSPSRKNKIEPIDSEERHLLEALELWRARGFKDDANTTPTTNGHLTPSSSKRAALDTTPKSSRKRKLREELMAAEEEEIKAAMDTSPTNRWIYLGPFIRFVPIYASSYPSPIKSADTVYVCEFCLKPLLDLCQFRNHVAHCPWKHPPGNEIYREHAHQTINIWEVEGNIETAYCRNLCLFAKLFLSSKTLHYEVETFTFYILTEVTPRGCVLAGYFSKEKNPTKNNNLSCLLTLPSRQGKGYGKFLIDLSYSLSKREHKIGSPEHPLSDSGLMAYRSYWRSAITCWLRERRHHQAAVSIKDMSIDTGIHTSDIVSTLLEGEALIVKSDCFYIDTDKAFNASPASLRRRTIKDDLLVWTPPFEVDGTNRMSSYATD